MTKPASTMSERKFDTLNTLLKNWAKEYSKQHGGRESARVSPRPGLMLLHRHGVDCWQHEALPVKAGTKYILRTDVVYSHATRRREL